jgi:hypothetical protein
VSAYEQKPGRMFNESVYLHSIVIVTSHVLHKSFTALATQGPDVAVLIHALLQHTELYICVINQFGQNL